MPLVEVLTTSKSHTTPGWAYVPDTSLTADANKPATSGGRKRGIREPAGRNTNLTSRQNHAILRHLAELDRENHRENVHIPVPARKESAAAQRVDHGRAPRAKTTSNVRRILQSQKTFKNYLDDEEAALAHQASVGVMGRQAGVGASGAATPAAVSTPVSKVAKAGTGRRSVTPSSAKQATPIEAPESDRQKRARLRKSLASAAPSTAETTGTGKSAKTTGASGVTASAKEEPTENADGDNDAMDIDSPAAAEPVKGLIKTPYDNDPLLRSYIPKPPSERLMAALLAEPPLTYNAARARPSASGKPPRYFCTICGYWGKIKCRNCGVRTCGLDCYKVHEDSRCGAFF